MSLNSFARDGLRDRRLTWPARGLLIFLHDELLFDTWTPMKIRYVGSVLGMSKGRVSTYLQELRALGYIERGAMDTAAGVFTYRLGKPPRFVLEITAGGTARAA